MPGTGPACWLGEAEPQYMALGLKAAGVAALALTLWTLRWAILRRKDDSGVEGEQVRGTLGVMPHRLVTRRTGRSPAARQRLADRRAQACARFRPCECC